MTSTDAGTSLFKGYERGGNHQLRVSMSSKLMFTDPRPESFKLCSHEYLQAILKCFVEVKHEFAFENGTAPLEDASVLLQEILKECDRLRESPVIFGQVQRYQDFFRTIRRYSIECLELSKRDPETTIMAKSLAREHLLESRSSYVPKVKDWNQFLKNGAPGYSAFLRLRNETATLQLIPYTGIKLLSEWTRKNARVRKRIEKV